MKPALFNPKLEDHRKLFREMENNQFGKDYTIRIPEHRQNKNFLTNFSKIISSNRKAKLDRIIMKI